MLDHKENERRVAAAYAIGRLAARDEAIDTLTEFIKKEKDEAVKMEIARIVLLLKAGRKVPQVSYLTPLNWPSFD